MRELGDDFYQEYPHTPESAFNAVHDGTYYAKHWRRYGTTVAKDLYDSALPVRTAWDLGHNDMMVIVFFQVYTDKVRIIDEYHNHGEGLDHYVSVLKERIKSCGYSYEKHILPHDVKVTELQTNKTRLATLRKLGMKNIKVLPRTKNVQNDIQRVREFIPKLAVDAEKASYIIKMFGRYTKKWDEVLGIFADKPLHDTWSNPADAVRYMVMSLGELTKKKRKTGSGGSTEGMAL